MKDIEMSVENTFIYATQITITNASTHTRAHTPHILTHIDTHIHIETHTQNVSIEKDGECNDLDEDSKL